MYANFTAIAALFALAFSSALFAQTSSATSVPSEQTLSMQKQQIKKQYQAAMKKCNDMNGNAKRICNAEADGQRKIEEKQVEVTARDTPKNRLELAEAKAEAQYMVAKAKCADQVRDAKTTCEKEAKAARDFANVQARRQSQTQTSTGGSGSGGSNASSTPSAGQATPQGDSASGGLRQNR